MRPIVCATRGGEVSRRTQERAIALANERDTELIFLCVVDPSFVKLVDKSLAETLADELWRMGKSLLSIAQARAKKRGIATQTDVLHGDARQSIEEYIRKVDASTLVIGATKTNSTPQVLGVGNVNHFAEAIHEATGVEVIVVT